MSRRSMTRGKSIGRPRIAIARREGMGKSNLKHGGSRKPLLCGEWRDRDA